MTETALVLVHSHPPPPADRASPFKLSRRLLNVSPAAPEQHWLRKIGTLRAVSPDAAALVEDLIDDYLDEALARLETEDRCAT